MKRLYLIRHGMTEANQRRLYCGSSDLPLSEAGVEALREKHYGIPQARFLTSGMTRTEQTLRCLFGEVPHEADDRFREVDFGVFELRSYQELKDDPEYICWISGNNEENVPPQGESGTQMTHRVILALEELLTRQEDTVLITHGGVIAAMMAHLFPGLNRNRYQWQPKPGCGYEIRFLPDGTMDFSPME